MLSGLDRGWFQIYSDARSQMQSCIINRPQGNFAILIRDDFWALVYQIHHYRAKRAKYSLMGPGTRWYTFNDGKFDDDETAIRKGTAIEKKSMREDWERYMYAKKKIREDHSHRFEEY